MRNYVRENPCEFAENFHKNHCSENAEENRFYKFREILCIYVVFSHLVYDKLSISGICHTRNYKFVVFPNSTCGLELYYETYEFIFVFPCKALAFNQYEVIMVIITCLCEVNQSHHKNGVLTTSSRYGPCYHKKVHSIFRSFGKSTSGGLQEKMGNMFFDISTIKPL